MPRNKSSRRVYPGSVVVPTLASHVQALPRDLQDHILRFATGTYPVPDDQWVDRHDSFPQLKRRNCWVTREAPVHVTYNCVGYSVGDLECLEWDHDLQQMIAFYRSRGYVQTAPAAHDATIDLWVNEHGHFAHATRKFDGVRQHAMPIGLWESSPVADQAFTHGRFEIANAPYGSYARVAASFR